MKFNLQNHTLKLSNKSNNKAELKILFNLNNEYLTNAQSWAKKLSINPLDDLTEAGNTSINIIDKTTFLTISLGKNFNLPTYNKVLKTIANFMSKNKKLTQAEIILEEQIAKLLDQEFNYYAEQTIFHILNNMYTFDEFKSTKNTLTLKQLSFIAKNDTKSAIESAAALLEGLFIVKHLANNPSNIATPSYLAKVATNASKLSQKVSIEVLGEKEIQQLKMNAFLAVSQGSNEEAKFIKMEYKGGKTKQKPIVLVGKGITFDSGGISIKSGTKMDEMKYDMCGAATVIGTFFAAVKLDLAINLVVLVPTCENMPAGHALKPGNVITTMSGQTVEILNTDAEGRLILCDALTYAKSYQPELVIDIATLTGACVTALGNTASGLYSNDDKLADLLIKAANTTDDKVWRMPLFEEYSEMLNSDIADMKNIGSWTGVAGSPTAAVYLSKFVDYTWAHLDIAGTAWTTGGAASTGRPFYLIMNFLRNYKKQS